MIQNVRKSKILISSTAKRSAADMYDFKECGLNKDMEKLKKFSRSRSSLRGTPLVMYRYIYLWIDKQILMYLKQRPISIVVCI